MIIPKTVRILGKEFKIILSKKGLMEKKDSTSPGTLLDGYVSVPDQKIWIDNSLGKEQKVTTLLHELIEAIIFMLDIKIKHDDIERLEIGLYLVS